MTVSADLRYLMASSGLANCAAAGKHREAVMANAAMEMMVFKSKLLRGSLIKVGHWLVPVAQARLLLVVGQTAFD